MEALPSASPKAVHPSRIELHLAAMAFCSLIGIHLLSLVCLVGAFMARTKSEAVLCGSVIFVLMVVAVPVGFLALPAILSYRHLVWPRFAFALGFSPLLLLVILAIANLMTRLLRLLL